MLKKRNGKDFVEKVAPGIDPDASFGEDASEAEVRNDESTTVTRLSDDEYDPREVEQE